jgi:GT2 family glycosyltransferase
MGSTMRASIVIRSKDEADRLRLTLNSLACQTERPEVVVVNDGSSDHTREVIETASAGLDLVAIHHDVAQGRSAASNAGAERAGGDIVIFLDGDTLAAPDVTQSHIHAHGGHDNLIIRGATHHLRCTRFLLDPEAGTPRAGEERRIARMSDSERARSTVTRQQIHEDFAAIDARSEPGIYPGYGPRRLFEIEMSNLRDYPACTVLWAAASGVNLSVHRRAFLDCGGFDPELSINEHRELALRLCSQGLRMGVCEAKTYHLTHRVGWRDPLVDKDWENIFYSAHPIAEVALLPVFWESLGESESLPAAARLLSLPALALAANRLRDIQGPQAIREAHLLLTRRGGAAPATP